MESPGHALSLHRHIRLHRCWLGRLVLSGWHEGSVRFTDAVARPQPNASFEDKGDTVRRPLNFEYLLMTNGCSGVGQQTLQVAAIGTHD